MANEKINKVKIGTTEYDIQDTTSGYGKGTVTSVTAGTGLNGGTITTTGTVSVKYGSTSGTACEGNDARLSDSRTPKSHQHGSITNDGKIGTTANLAVVTSTGGTVATADLTTSDVTSSGTSDSFIKSVTQDSKGKITVQKAGLPSASSSTPGVVKLGASGGAATYSHTHDDRYYTESEVDSKLSGKQDTLSAQHGIQITSNNEIKVVEGYGLTTYEGELIVDTSTIATKTDLDSYYTKSETFNKTEVNSKVAEKVSKSGDTMTGGLDIDVKGDSNKVPLHLYWKNVEEVGNDFMQVTTVQPGGRLNTTNFDVADSGTTGSSVTLSFPYKTGVIATLDDIPTVPTSYLTNASVSGKTLTLTKADGSSVKFTDTDTTYTASTGLNLSSNAFSVKYGNTAGTACQGNDSRLSDARPASDVYSWAKASTKPSYNYGEIGAGIATGAILDVHPESTSSLIAYYTNDLVNLVARGGSISATNKTRGTSIDVSGTVNGTPSYSSFTVTAVTDVVEILISSPAYSWNTNFGIGFGSSNWRAKDVKIEVGYEADGTTDWVTVLDVKNSGNQIHNIKASGPNVRTSTYTWNRLRYTLTNFNNTSPRIAGIWTQNYGSNGLANNFLQTAGGTVYGQISASNLLPRTNNTYSLGNSSNQWKEIRGVTIYQNGTKVSVEGHNHDSTYLKLNGEYLKSVAINGKTLTITKSDGGTAAITDTWRPIGSGATDAAAGNHNHDSTYLKLSGGTLTGNLNLSGGGIGIIPTTDGYGTIGNSEKAIGDIYSHNISGYGGSNLNAKSGIKPETTNSFYLGTPDYQWKGIYGKELFQNGTKVSVEGHTHTWANITNPPASYTPSSHSHGNITNAGAIGTTSGNAVYTTTNGVLTAGSLATSDPTASGTSTSFISTISQDAKGKITVTKANLPTASSSTAGITKVGASGGAAAFTHSHADYLSRQGGTITYLDINNGQDGDTPLSIVYDSAVNESPAIQIQNKVNAGTPYITEFYTEVSGDRGTARKINIPAASGTLALLSDISWANVSGKPSTFTPSAHNQSWSTITDKPSTYTPSAHNQAWSTITDKPASYTPSSHTHDDRYYTESEMNTKLSGKSDTSHTHSTSIAASTATNQITLAHGSKYAITAGGTSYVFTMPSSGAPSTYLKSVAVNGSTLTLTKQDDSTVNFTNTWRGIQNVLTSDSTTDSLSAAQGKALKTLVDGKAASGHTHNTSMTPSTSTPVITLVSGATYQLSAGGTSYVFKMPADTNTHLTNSLIIKGNGTEAVKFTQNADKTLNFKGSGATSVSKTADGEITISSTNTTYGVATSSALGLVKSATTGTTSGRDYNVQVNSDGTMKVNVPWTDNNTTYSAGSYLALNGTTFSLANSGLAMSRYLYHDIAAFCNAATPLYETSADGSTGWTTATLDKNIFAARENFSTNVTSTTKKGSRFTWKGGMSWSSIGYALIGWTYSDPSATVKLVFESSADSGATWTLRKEITNITANASAAIYDFGGINGDGWFRLSIIQTSSTGSKNISTIKLLTQRWGDHGLGSEYEKPYVADGNKHIYPWSNNAQNLGTSSNQWKEIRGVTIYQNGTQVSNVGHKHAWSDITSGVPATYTPSAHNQSWSTITDKPASYTPSAHNHDSSYVSKLTPSMNGPITVELGGITDEFLCVDNEGMATKLHFFHTNGANGNIIVAKTGTIAMLSDIAWGNVSGKPSTFTPSSHTHDDRYYTESEVDTKLSGKAASSHKHNWADLNNPPASYTPSSHSHTPGMTPAASTETSVLSLTAGGKYKLNVDGGTSFIFTMPGDSNSHRPIQMNGTEILGNNTTALNLKAGSNVTLSNSSGTVTINATNTTYGVATTSADGLMSKTDKSKLDGIASGATKVIESTVSGWGFTKNAGTVTSVAVKMNGAVKGTITSSGTIDLGTVLTAHQDISGKANTSGTYSGLNVGYASSAGTATNMNYSSAAAKGAGYMHVRQYSGATDNPTDDWYSHIIFNHANNNGYFQDIATCFHSDNVYLRRQSSGTTTSWKRFIMSGDNISGLNNDAGYVTSSNLGTTAIKVTRGSNVKTDTTGYWAAMSNNGQDSTGHTVLPAAGWWHVLSMDWANDATNWVSQLALPTQDGGNIHFRRNNASGTNINSSTWQKIPFWSDMSWGNIGGKPSFATVATSGSYTDLINKPSIPAAANNGVLTIQKNGTNVTTFSANQSTNATANITVPTKVSELSNDTGYVTSSGVTSVSVKMNGASKGTVTTSGTIDLGTVITAHQDISGKENTSNKVTAWSSTTTDAHYPSEKLVKTALDGKASSTHDHTLSIAADSGTNQLTLAASTKYKLTAGGKSFIFTTAPNNTYSAGTGLSLSSGAFSVTYGNAANTACQGNDSRLSNSRTPTAHASTATTYGAGTTSNYGHVKTQSGDMNGTSSTDGIAAGLGHTHSQYAGTGHNHDGTYYPLSGGTINGSIIPNNDDGRELGSSTIGWKAIHTHKITGCGANITSSDGIRPETTNAKYLGTPDYQWKGIYGQTIYQNGTQVANVGHTHNWSDIKNVPSANASTAGITKLGVAGGAALYGHNHDSQYISTGGGTLNGYLECLNDGVTIDTSYTRQIPLNIITEDAPCIYLTDTKSAGTPYMTNIWCQDITGGLTDIELPAMNGRLQPAIFTHYLTLSFTYSGTTYQALFVILTEAKESAYSKSSVGEIVSAIKDTPGTLINQANGGFFAVGSSTDNTKLYFSSNKGGTTITTGNIAWSSVSVSDTVRDMSRAYSRG